MITAPAEGPFLGAIVHYKLTEPDAFVINERRAKIKASDKLGTALTVQGNHAREGDIFPAIVVRIVQTGAENEVNPPVNLQVFLDGDDSFWATSRHERDAYEFASGTYAAPYYDYAVVVEDSEA